MREDPATIQADFRSWEKLPSPLAASQPNILSVSAEGLVSLGVRLLREMRERAPKLAFDFYLSPDGLTLCLEQTCGGAYTFPANGRRKDCALGQKLVGHGISLPARYHVAWNDNAKAWVGCLVSEIEADRVQALKKSLMTVRRKKGGRPDAA